MIAMNDVREFIRAASPWVAMGLLVAEFGCFVLIFNRFPELQIAPADQIPMRHTQLQPDRNRSQKTP